MSRITLSYWNGRGLMEVPRLLLAIAGKFPGDYDDRRLNEPPSSGLEANLGRMPIASVGDNTIGQSVAINYFIAAEVGLAGSNAFETAQILSVGEHIKEMMKAFRDLVPYGTEPTEEKLDTWFTTGATDATGPADRAGYSTRFAKWWFGRIEASLTGTNGFAVGNSVTLADVLIYNAFAEVLRDEEAKPDFAAYRRVPFGDKARTDAALASCPRLLASIAAVANHPNAQRWFATRGVQDF